MKNRLRLDFRLERVEERQQFLELYLENPEFKDNPLTQKELETISSYLLWGKDYKGVSVGKDLNLKTKNGTWDKERKVESIEELSEQINFNENSFRQLTDLSVKPKIKKEAFSREIAKLEAPPFILLQLRRLWRQIDETDLLINFYELRHKKKKSPIRDSLLQKFNRRDLKKIHEKAKKLEPYEYLKKKHLLVELRREQFILKDSYTTSINAHPHYYAPPQEKDFFTFPKIFPFGAKTPDRLGEILFTRELNPKELSETELQKLSRIFWEEKEERRKSLEGNLDFLTFDFRRLEDVYQLLQFYEEVQDENLKNLEESNLKGELGELLETLNFYIDLAELTEAQSLILKRKIQKVPNEKIRKEVNEKFSRSYTTNYISTIYRHKIIKKINEAAQFHEKIIENYFYPENFKKCSRCGRLFLIDQRNFVRKRASKDGFNPRCKFCDRVKREEKRIKKLDTLEINKKGR